MKGLLRSSALALLFSSVLPFAAPDLFIYKSAQAENAPSIPSWVQATCCGPKDVHHLRPDQVSDMGDYYIIDGFNEPIPKVFKNGVMNDHIKPSQDGDYWAFFSSTPGHWESNMYTRSKSWENTFQDLYCLFIPMAF